MVVVVVQVVQVEAVEGVEVDRYRNPCGLVRLLIYLFERVCVRACVCGAGVRLSARRAAAGGCANGTLRDGHCLALVGRF